MIVKILSRHSPSYAGLIRYILKEGKGGEDERPEPYLHNFRGHTEKEWVRELCINEAFRKQQRKGQVYFYHTILSFNELDSDKITKDMLQDITKKFIELRGKDAMYIAAQHRDREHTHIHLLVSGLSYRTGKAFRMTKGEMRELKISLQCYQQEKYGLEHSLPNHGAGREYLSQKEYGAKSKNSTRYLKAELKQKVDTILLQSNSLQDFISRLQENSLYHYERGNKVYGITVNEKNYRFSSLGVDIEMIKTMKQDLSEEETALGEIGKIRKQINNYNLEETKENDMDI